MMKLRIVAVWLCLLAVLSACEDEGYDSPSVPNSIETRLPKPSDVAKGNRTVLVYMIADNSLSGFASDDLAEMKEGLKSVDVTENNLLIYIDNRKTNRSDRSTDSVPRLIRLGKDKKGRVVEETLVRYKEQNSVDMTVMRNVLQTTFKYYPAENYGIVFWSHGEGWVPAPSTTSTRWFGQDDNNYMNISDLHEVLKVVPHFDYIFFDACYMQSVEVAYELRDCSDYIIGSPTEIPGPGAPYQEVVPKMFTSVEAAKGIADAYFSFYNDNYDEKKETTNTHWTAGVSISALKTDILENLAVETQRVLADYLDEIPHVNTSSLLCYDPYRANNYWDLSTLIERTGADNGLYKQWKSVFNELFVFINTTPKNYCTFPSGKGKLASMEGFNGISIYIPTGVSSSKNNEYYRTFEWSQKTGWGQYKW